MALAQGVMAMAYRRCPILPMSALWVRGVMYTDADPPQGLISEIQRRLRELGARDDRGQLPPVTGQYDEYTAHVLNLWVASDMSRWPSYEMGEATGGVWVTDCNVYRALGIDCEELESVPGTPNPDRVRVYLNEGKLSLRCQPLQRPPVSPAPPTAAEVHPVLAGVAAVAVTGLNIALVSRKWKALSILPRA